MKKFNEIIYDIEKKLEDYTIKKTVETFINNLIESIIILEDE